MMFRLPSPRTSLRAVFDTNVPPPPLPPRIFEAPAQALSKAEWSMVDRVNLEELYSGKEISERNPM